MRWFTCLILFFNFFIIHVIHGQIENYEVINFSAEDGLPSNECHDIVQDSLGYVWIATDRGLSRFDGYGFKNYGKEEGLDDLSCLKLYLDRHNNIWISTFSKKIFIYIALRDTIITYDYNHLLEQYYLTSSFNFMNYLDECDDAYFEIDRTGIIKITKNGRIILPDTENVKPNQFYSFEIEDKFMMGISKVSYMGNKVKLKVGFSYQNSYINHKGTIFLVKYDKNQKIFGNAKAFKYSDSNYLYTIHGHQHFFKNKTLLKTRFGTEINDLIELEDSLILTAQIFRQGVKVYKNNQDFMNDKYLPFLENISATRFLNDRQDNIFISTIEDGFYYLKRKSIKLIDLENYSEMVVSKLSKKNENNLLILLDEKNVVEKHLYNKSLKQTYKSPDNILDISYNQKSAELYIAGQTSWIIDLTLTQKKPIGFCGVKYKYMMGYKRYIRIKNNILALGYEMFGVYSDMHKSPDFCSEGTLPRKRFISGSDYKNDTYLLGALDGLFILNGNTLIKSDSIHPIFRSRINDIQNFKGNYLLGTLGNGLGIWDGEKKIGTIKKSDGILTDNIERIYVDDSQNIYLCTKMGLSKITFESDNQYKIQNFTRHHGLTSNIINDVIQMGDSLYIATANGLCILPIELKIKNEIICPIIEQMMVNNRVFNLFDLPNSLHYIENNITFHYKSLDHSLSGDVTYRIRLNQNEWIETKLTSISFSTLNPGKYTFQVQAMNRDLKWSKAVTHTFEIKKPWWETTQIKILGFFIISILGYTLYKNRINKIRDENRIKNEMTSLERSALQAQMNPHFIFNCLNSIQNYIMRNDKDTAMDYLGKFAHLIRQYLNASTSDAVKLEDEISMLENYLRLEQMRFNHTFDYTFEIEPAVNISSIKLPPMLIQPFIENSVLHGMTSIPSGGIINITFSQNNGKLNIIIKDNGTGFNIEKTEKQRKSLGIAITQKRLQYINENKDENYSITTKSSENGTEVNIFIKTK